MSEPLSDEGETRIIKRYNNRKMYDTKDSCYITLKDIRRLVEKGEEVRIVDRDTKEDITTATLTSILLDGEKQKRHAVPLSAVKELIKESGVFFRNHIGQPVTSMGQEAFEHATEGLSRLGEAKEEGRKAIKDFVEHSHKRMDELGKRFEDKFRKAVEGIAPALLKQIGDLNSRLDELEARIETLEKKLEQKGEIDPPPAKEEPNKN